MHASTLFSPLRFRYAAADAQIANFSITNNDAVTTTTTPDPGLVANTEMISAVSVAQSILQSQGAVMASQMQSFAVQYEAFHTHCCWILA